MSVSQNSARGSSSVPRYPGIVHGLERLAQSLPVPPIVWRIARFLAVGLVGLAVDSAVFWGAYNEGVSIEFARALSLALATFVTWFLNRLFTFAPSGRAPGREFARYVGVALVAQGFNYGLFLALMRFDAGAHPLICLVVSAVATAALSFTGQSLIAFRSTRGR